jgi:hypothetical protein
MESERAWARSVLKDQGFFNSRGGHLVVEVNGREGLPVSDRASIDAGGYCIGAVESDIDRVLSCAPSEVAVRESVLEMHIE